VTVRIGARRLRKLIEMIGYSDVPEDLPSVNRPKKKREIGTSSGGAPLGYRPDEDIEAMADVFGGSGLNISIGVAEEPAEGEEDIEEGRTMKLTAKQLRVIIKEETASYIDPMKGAGGFSYAEMQEEIEKTLRLIDDLEEALENIVELGADTGDEFGTMGEYDDATKALQHLRGDLENYAKGMDMTGEYDVELQSKLAAHRRGELDEGDEEDIDEVAPPGWEGSVKAMKKHGDIDNPWALAWHMKGKGDKPHYTERGRKKKGGRK
jgi:hypothetical protein